MIRPEALRLGKAPRPGSANALTGTIDSHVFLGGLVELVLALPGGERIKAAASPRELEEAGITLAPNEAVTINVAEKDVVLL